MRILFIGNSFTSRNDLPGTLAALAAAAGRGVTHALVSAGGASLRQHWNKGGAARAIERGGKWDYVVLQEQSTLPLKNAGRFHENVRLFDPVVRAAGATLTLYMTWARQSADADARERLEAAYDAIGTELSATVVPVGRAWHRLLAEPDPPPLYDKDGSHPSPAGTYLAACAFHATLLGRLPEPLGVVDAPIAKRLHAAATRAS